MNLRGDGGERGLQYIFAVRFYLTLGPYSPFLITVGDVAIRRGASLLFLCSFSVPL
jgi:hypothetical protein